MSDEPTTDVVLGSDRTLSMGLLNGSMAQLYSLNEAPQIHIHLLTTDEEFKERGWGTHEICCHGCGASLLIYFDNNDSSLLSLPRRIFFEEHKNCPDFGYATWCPGYRTKFYSLDLRGKNGNTS